MPTRLTGSLAALALGAASAVALAQAPKPAEKPMDKKAAAAPPAPATAPTTTAKPALGAPGLPVAAPAAAAAPAPPPAAPKPAPELDHLKYFEGSWRCEGKVPAGPMGPEHGYKSTFKVKKDMDGFWYACDYEQKKSKDNPMPVKARGYFTYEPGSKKYLFVGIDNMGGTVTETSSGFEGDKMVSAGDGTAMGQRISFRETFTRKSDREMSWLGEMKMGKDWMVVGSDVCKK